MHDQYSKLSSINEGKDVSKRGGNTKPGPVIPRPTTPPPAQKPNKK